MPIRLRLALACAVAAAFAFALGGWLFISALSSAQLGAIDSQLAVELGQAGRYLPAASAPGSSSSAAASPPPGEYVIQVVDPADRVRGASPDAGTAPLLSAAELAQARNGRISVTRTIDEENTRVTAGPLAGHPGWVAVAGLSLGGFDSTQSQVIRELAITIQRLSFGIGGDVFMAGAAGLRECRKREGCTPKGDEGHAERAARQRLRKGCHASQTAHCASSALALECRSRA